MGHRVGRRSGQDERSGGNSISSQNVCALHIYYKHHNNLSHNYIYNIYIYIYIHVLLVDYMPSRKVCVVLQNRNTCGKPVNP